MSESENRAHLPRGLPAIREHLKACTHWHIRVSPVQRVDDVPLLVSLFTESASPAITGMLAVQQEYGAVVCCLGSSLNATNAVR